MALPKLFQRIFWHNNTTPALAEDNLNAMSKGLSDVDDRLISLAGTIQEDVVEIQEDMEILNEALETIDDSVASAQGSASTASAKAIIASNKALVAEGFAVGEQNGTEVGQDSDYYQNNAKYYAEIANPPIENTVDFTDIIAVTDAINKAAKDVKLKVEAVQDLHGYDKPWVGGAGKNLLPMTVASIKAANTSGTWSGNAYTKSGVTFTVQTDADGNVTGIKANGTASADLFINCGSEMDFNGTHLVSGISGGSATTYFMSLDSESWSFYSGDREISYSTSTPRKVCINIKSGYNIQNVIFYPMVRNTGTTSTFEPYTNICPITGHSEAKVTRSGKNLLDMPSSVVVPRGTNWLNAKTITLKAGTYTFSCKSTATSGASSFEVYDASNNLLYSGDFAWGAEVTKTFTISGTAAYIYAWTATATTLTELQIESGNQKTVYEPFTASDLFTISLNGTRYGGTLDVTSGVLTLTHEYADLGTLTWQALGATTTYDRYVSASLDNIVAEESIGICSQYFCIPTGGTYRPGGFKITAPRNSLSVFTNKGDYASAAAFTTAMSGVQLVYPLATPQTITLTAEEVTLLWAYNTLWADTGDIALTYDASGVLRIANAKLDTETLKTIAAASSDFADFKSRVAQL